MKTLTFLLLTFSLCSFAFDGGSGAGNGGDSPRMEFLKIGNNIIDYYQEGFKKINRVVTNPEQLRAYLNINVVRTSVEVLVDNRNNPVSAIGMPNSITLYVGDSHKDLSWTTVLQDRRSAERLVLHEMLRAHGVNDDNYVYTNKVLAEQDIIEGEGLRMKWSMDTLNSIRTSLLLGIKATNIEAETKVYARTIEDIKKINNLSSSKLLTLPIELSQSLSEEMKEREIVLIRRDLKLVRDLVPYADKITFEKIKNKTFAQENSNRLLFLVLKDFTMKFADFGGVNNQPFANFMDDLVNISSSDEDFKSNCSQTIQLLKETQKTLIEPVSKRDVLKKVNMVIYLLQRGQC